MSSEVNSFGRTSPTTQIPIIPKYKEKHDKNTDKNADKNADKNGRNSPSKFVFTLYPNKEKTHNKANHKYNHIKPILSVNELENNQYRSISVSPTSNEPLSISPTRNEPLSISPTSNRPKYFRNKSFRSTSKSPQNIIPKNTIKPIVCSEDINAEEINAKEINVEEINAEEINEKEINAEEINAKEINIDDINKIDIKEKPISNTYQVSNIQYLPHNNQSVKVFNKFEYYTKSQLIYFIKHLVYQHYSLICGSFNVEQLFINEDRKSVV
jgi:hypothetical protein